MTTPHLLLTDPVESSAWVLKKCLVSSPPSWLIIPSRTCKSLHGNRALHMVAVLGASMQFTLYIQLVMCLQ